MMVEITGSLKPKLITEYKNLVKNKVFHKKGGNNSIIFANSHVIKYPTDPCFYQPKHTKKDFGIGKDLKENGFHVPEMHTMYLDYEKDNYFLVMSRHKMEELRKLDRGGMRIEEEFEEQFKKIQKLGYYTSDLWYGKNCAWDEEAKKILFYDFELWEGPRLKELEMGAIIK